MTVSELFGLGITAMLIENIVLSSFLGICPFLGVSKKESSAIGMSGAVIFVLLLSSTVAYLLYHYVMVPLEITYLRTIIFILVIASLVQFVEMFVKKASPALYKSLGIYLPLITTNCAVLGVAVLNIDNEFTFVQMLVFSAFSALGFALVLFIFASIRESLAKAPIPRFFKGAPIALIVAAILAMIFTRFAGII